jgi:hypothetical protein
MDKAIEIVNLLNSATPGIASLVMMIRRNDGTITVAALLDEADKNFQTNIQQAKDWLAQNKG